MKKLMMIAAVCAATIMTGCGTPAKMRDVEVKGMYVNGYSEVLAIGAGRVTSIPGEREAMAAHYREDTAWLSPSTKTHELDLFLVGTNSVENAEKIIEHICSAFKDVAPTIAQTDAEVDKAGGTTPLDVIKGGGEVRKAVQTAKAAAAATQASSATATAAQSATATSATGEQAADACTGDICTTK